MGKYKVDISGYSTSNLNVLSNEEMRSLFLCREDPSSRDLLIEGNLRLVLSILKNFYNKTENMDDLFQVGCVGLIKAIDNFDLSYDVQFSTYAVPMILGEIKRFIRDGQIIKVSRYLKDINYKANKLMDGFYQDNGYDMPLSDVAFNLGVSEFDVGNALSALREPVSMYEPVYNDGGDTIYLYDQIVDDSLDNDFSNKITVDDAMRLLDDREKYILDQIFVVGKTQMEVADELNISQAQVSRLEKKAIKELKKVLL